jgi:hypothetical protein
MRYSLVLLGIAIAGASSGGCVGPGECEDCYTGPPIPVVTAYDDGTTLTVIGCAAAPFDPGCDWASEAMTATIGQATLDVPAAMSTDATLIGGVAVRYDHRVDVPSPTTAIELSALYGSDGTETFPDLPAFTVTGPGSAVTRGDAPVEIDFAVLQNTDALVVLTSTCDGSAAPYMSLQVPSETGQVDLELGGLPATGSCTHELDVSQTQAVLVDPPSDLGVSVVRIASVTFTSTP